MFLLHVALLWLGHRLNMNGDPENLTGWSVGNMLSRSRRTGE